MKLTRFSNSKEFLENNQRYLEKEEVMNSLLMGLAMSQDENDDSLYLNIVNENGVQFSGMKTRERNLIINGELEQLDAFAPKLIAYLQKEQINIPGINGPRKITMALADRFKSETGRSFEVEFKQMVYRLTELNENPDVKGHVRKAEESDVGLISEWFHAFNKEALQHDDMDHAKQTAINKIKRGEVYIWEDGGAVTMTCIARPTVNGISINYVYTPEAHRKKGYGTKLVAEVSKQMLHKGFQFCTLFADEGNPTSNNIYQKIGYVPVKEFRVIKFDKEGIEK